MNGTIHTGDNLDILKSMDAGSVDLVYTDPPFNTGGTYASPDTDGAAKGAAFHDSWSDKAEEEYSDPSLPLNVRELIWGLRSGGGNLAYLTFMASRLVALRRVMKPTATIYLHCSHHEARRLGCVMDAVFGASNYISEVVWAGAKANSARSSRKFVKAHDTLWVYRKGAPHTFNHQFQDYKPSSKESANFADESGDYKLSPLGAPRNWTGTSYRYNLGMGEKPSRNGYCIPEAEMRRRIAAGQVVVRKGKVVAERYYFDRRGCLCSDVWDDITATRGGQVTGYPTQKPEALLERVILASSNAGDSVLDPFAGSGTAAVVAERTGRRWIAIDISDKATDLIRKRVATDTPPLLRADAPSTT